MYYYKILFFAVFTVSVWQRRKADMHHEALFEENHDEAICKSLRDRLIYAYIYVSSKKATVYTKSLRVTLTDHIANLGTFTLKCVIPNQKRPSFLHCRRSLRTVLRPERPQPL